MHTVHEGEILLKEKYGSSARQRVYVKPPDQHNIVILDESRLSNVTSWFTRIFLPQGYPDSVSSDYLSYQIWDTAQAFCSTITGILATQEVLRGVGVGDTSATPLAATITWVIKDGCGHIGRILFAFSHGTYLDAYSKKWRLYADTLNDAAMCIEIALPLFKNYTTFALCVSTVMKAIVGVAGGATRAAMTQHHAIRGNMADVAAKDSAQETAVNLVASLAALMIISVFGNCIIIFIMMMILHITCNYFAVRAVCLKTLNEPRFLQVIEMYIKKEIIATPCEINQNEPIVFYQLGPNLLDLKIAGFQIKLGASIMKIIKENPKAMRLSNIMKVYEDRSYILVPDVSMRKMFVLIKDDASTDDILCAYFHVVLLSIVICAINDDNLPLYRNASDVRPFAQVCRTLQAAEWSREPAEAANPLSRFAYEPSIDLMVYVDKIVNKEWFRTRAGLVHTGWDLNKHLLMVDEWRVCNDKIVKKAISAEQLLPYMPSEVNPASKTTAVSEVIDVIPLDDYKQKEFTIEPEENRQRAKAPTQSLEASASQQKVLNATEVKPKVVPKND